MPSENNIFTALPARLPVAKILLGTLAISWMQRQKLLRGLGGTVALIIAIKLVWHVLQANTGTGGTMLFLVVSMLLHTKFAVICHRMILVDFDTGPKTISPFRWSDRETRFFGWMVTIYFLVSIGSIIITMIPFSLFSQSLPEATRNDPTQILPYAILFIGPLATYLLARLSPIFPAVATDRVEKLSWYWRLSRNNSLQLMVIVGLIPWTSGLINYFIVGSKPDLLTVLLVNIANYVFMALEVIALSLAYRELVRERNLA